MTATNRYIVDELVDFAGDADRTSLRPSATKPSNATILTTFACAIAVRDRESTSRSAHIPNSSGCRLLFLYGHDRYARVRAATPASSSGMGLAVRQVRSVFTIAMRSIHFTLDALPDDTAAALPEVASVLAKAYFS